MATKIRLSHIITSLAKAIEEQPDRCKTYIKSHNLERQMEIIGSYISASKQEEPEYWNSGRPRRKATHFQKFADDASDDEFEPPAKKSVSSMSATESEHEYGSGCESERSSSHETTDDDDSDDEPIPRLYYANKSLGIPTCLRLFKLDLFKTFLSLRRRVDSLFDQKESIFCLQNGQYTLHLDEDSLDIFQNAHALAYFYYKMYHHGFQQKLRLNALMYLAPNFDTSGEKLQNLHQWGSVLDGNSDYQWIGGVTDDVINYTTVINWKYKLMILEKHKKLYKRVTIDNVSYVIPK
jgi:hypothetical protein